MTLKLRVLACLLALGTTRSTAETPETGTTRSSFYKLGSGARAIALGEAFAAVPGNASCLAYNPGGLKLAGSSFQTSTNVWFQGTLSQHFEATLDLLELGSFGASFHYLVLPAQDVTVKTASTGDPTKDYRLAGSYQPFESYATLGYGRDLMGIHAGISLKLMLENMGLGSTAAVDADLGLVKELSKTWLLGLSVQNLGLPGSMDARAFMPPILLRAGSSWRLFDGKLMPTVEIDLPNDNSLVAAAGLEYKVGGMLYPRIGYRMDSIFNPWSAGVGLGLGQFNLDFAVQTMGELGLVYRASASWRLIPPKLDRNGKPVAPRIKPQVAKQLPVIQAPPPPPLEDKTALALLANTSQTGASLPGPDQFMDAIGLKDLLNKPEPFKAGGTYLYFLVQREAEVQLEVYDDGKLVRSVQPEHFAPGERHLYFDGRDSKGRTLRAGRYQYRLIATRKRVKEHMDGTFSRGSEDSDDRIR